MPPLSSAGRAAGQIVDPALAARARASQIARIQAELGAGAARATGESIPRPKPAADALPSPPSRDAFFVPARAMLTPPQANALLRKAREGRPLTLEEMYFLTDPSILPDPALKELDNLETSSIPLNDTEVIPKKDNLTPNYSRVKESDIDRLYNEINNAVDPNSATNSTQFKRTTGRLEAVLANPEARAKLYARFGDPEFADARIGGFRRLAGDGDITDAAKIDRAADSRAAAGTARGTGDLPSAEAAVTTARQTAGAPLPNAYDGLDVAGLAEVFNNLPDNVRLELGEKLAASDPMLARLITREGGAVSISPNAVAAFRAPRSEYHGLLMELDTARRLGDPELEAAIKSEIMRDVNRLTADDARGRSDGNQLFQNQRNALDALRREMIATIPAVAESVSGARRAAITPPAPMMRAPDARSVEVAGTEIPEYELPGMFEDSLARMRERLADDQIRPSNPVKESEAKALAKKAGLPQSQLPVALQDRPENRSLASRGGVSQAEEKAILELRAAEEAFAAAATQPEKLAAAQRLKDAQVKFNNRFAGSKSKTTSGAVKGTEDAAEGGNTVTVQGRARGDKSLNKQSQEELTRSLFDTVVGWRDRPDRPLARSDVEFSEAERAKNALDAQRQLSYDVGDTTPQDMMPQGGDVEDLSMLGEGGKRGRLGGRQAKSRVAQSLQNWFAADSGKGPVINPLELFDGDTPAERAAAAADYIMRSRANTRIEGSPAWEMAREDIRSALEAHFGPAAGRSLGTDAADLPSPESAEGPTIAGTSQDPASVPAIAGRTNVAGTPPEPPARTDFSQPATPSTPEEAALEASAVELGDSSPIPEKPAATPVVDSKPVAGKKLTAKEIKAEADRVFKDTLAQEQEAGAPLKQATATANAARLRKVKELQGLNPSEPIPEKPAAAAKPEPATFNPATGEFVENVPASKADDVVDSKPVDAPAGSKKNPKADADTPKDGKDTKTKDGTDAKKADDNANPEKAPPKKSRLPYYLTGAALVGGGAAVLSNIGGGGSGVAVAGGGPMPAIPGGSVAYGSEMEQEDAINRALARLRGSRASADDGTTQVIQNWTGWR